MLLLNLLRRMVRRAAADCTRLQGPSEQQRRLKIKPRLILGSLFICVGVLASIFIGLAGFTSAGDEHGQRQQTFTVLVGAEDSDVGAGVTGFFPDTLRIHVGDTVHWQRNTNEIHTVTFLVDMPLPPFNVPAPPGLPSPLMRNPLIAFPVAPEDGRYDGTTFATSGIFGPDPDIFQGVESFDLIFTRPGTYNYVCVVHGARMSGQIIVVERDEHIHSPRQVDREARRSIAAALADVPAAIAAAEAEVPPPTQNPDGTATYHVLAGFSAGPHLDLLRFFPDDLTVQPGDTIEWVFGMQNMPVPHTITFLNGNESPDDLVPVPQEGGPPLLVVSPELFFPQNADQPLSRDDIHHSGLLRWLVGDPPPRFSLQIGDISGEESYQCLVHDGSGMLATLNVVP